MTVMRWGIAANREREAPVVIAANGPEVRSRVAMVLSVVAVVSMLASSVIGLAAEGLYGVPSSTASMIRAYDLVTLVVVVPALTVALFGAAVLVHVEHRRS